MPTSDEALQQFGKSIGLPQLKFNPDRVCELTVGENLEIFFEATEREGEMRLNGRLGPIHNADGSVLRQLLMANYNGQGTGAAALSLDPLSGEAVLGRIVDANALDATAFAAAVETFLKYLAFWTKHLPTLTPAAAPAAVAPSEHEVMFRI